ncbi:MAG: hypothetical protein AAFW68_00160 [Pseudomonadota bacterium]
MKNQTDIKKTLPQTALTQDAPEESWRALHERIKALAHRRSKAMLSAYGEDDETFDKGARALRTLMSAAEVANRMEREEAKDETPHEEGAGRTPLTSEVIEAEYEKIRNTISALECSGQSNSIASVAARANGGADPVDSGAGPCREILEN